MRWPLWLAGIVGFLGAGCDAPPPRAKPWSEAQTRLLREADPLAASTALRALAAPSCEGLVGGLAILDARVLAPKEGPPAWTGSVLTGLVDDALSAAHANCPRFDALARLEATGAATRLARARLLAERPADALAALADAPAVPAVRRRRAELLVELHRADAATAELRAALAEEDDPGVRVTLADVYRSAGHAEEALRVVGTADVLAVRTARAAALAALGRAAELATLIREAPLPERAELARAAVLAIPAAETSAKVVAGDDAQVPVELLVAAGARLASATPPRFAEAAALLARAAALAPGDADVQQAAAEALGAADQIDVAIAAWDRTLALAPALEHARLQPIRVLVAAHRPADARRRAQALAAAARRTIDPDDLRIASEGAALAGVPSVALALAREAAAAAPSDGKLQILVADRLAEARQHAEAARILARLLVCGSQGQPWHRHDLAPRLAKIGQANAGALRTALDTVTCSAVEPEDLAPYLEALTKQLR